MKELKFKKATQQGMVEGILRVIGRDLFFKYKDSQYSKQIVENFKKKGVDITEGRGWIKVDLLKNNEVVKLGNYEIDKDDPYEEAENKLFDFYKDQYKIMGFLVEEKE